MNAELNEKANRLYTELKLKYPDKWTIRGVAVEKSIRNDGSRLKEGTFFLTVLIGDSYEEVKYPLEFEGIQVEGALVGVMNVPYYNNFYVATSPDEYWYKEQ